MSIVIECPARKNIEEITMENLSETGDPAPGPVAEFRPTWHSGVGRTAIVSAVLALVTGAGAVVAEGAPLVAIAAAALASVFAWLAWFGGRQVWGSRPILRLAADGISGRALKGATLAWESINYIRLESLQGQSWLDIRLLAEDPPDTRSGIMALRPSQRRIPLSGLRSKERPLAFEAMLRAFGYWAPARARQTLDEHARQRQAGDDFDARLRAATPIVWAMPLIVALCTGVWVLNVASGMDAMNPQADDLLRWGGNAASAVQDGQWWRMFTAMFLHGGILHLGLNMYALWGAGMLLTRWFGNRGFLVVYMGSGLVGSALSLHFSAQTSVSVGASGAVFGVVGAVLVALMRHKEHFPAARRKQLLTSLAIFVFYSLFQGFARTGIDNAAHVGGLLAGLGMGRLLIEQIHETATPVLRSRHQAIGAALCLVATILLASMAAPAARDLSHFYANVEAVQAVESLVARERNLLQEEKKRLDALGPARPVTEHAYAGALDRFAAALREGAARLAPLRWGTDDPFGRYAEAERTFHEATAALATFEALALQGKLPAGSQKRRATLTQAVSAARDKVLSLRVELKLARS